MNHTKKGDRGVDAADTAGADDEDGVFTSNNITVAAYIAAPLLAFALLACFCARRRSRQNDSATVAGAGAVAGTGGEPWMKNDGTPAHVGGAGAVVAAGAVSRSNSRRSDKHSDIGASSSSTKIFPTNRSISPKSSRNGSRGVRDFDGLNLAGGLVVGQGAAGTPKGRRPAGQNPKQFARCESDTAFAVTTTNTEDAGYVGDARSSGGSSGGGVTGRSNSPPGYDDDMVQSVDDDAAASAFDGSGRFGIAAAAGAARAAEDDDDLSENGWGSFRKTSDAAAAADHQAASRGSRAPPSYQETRRRDERMSREQQGRHGDQRRGRGESRSHSNREGRSSRSQEMAGGDTGGRRQGAPRRSDGSRSSSMR